MTSMNLEAVSLALSLLALIGAGVFFWSDKKVAGFAFLVAFVIAFSAVLHQKVVLSSAMIGVTVERSPVVRPATEVIK
jgi:hypothetical protein